MVEKAATAQDKGGERDAALARAVEAAVAAAVAVAADGEEGSGNGDEAHAVERRLTVSRFRGVSWGKCSADFMRGFCCKTC